MRCASNGAHDYQKGPPTSKEELGHPAPGLQVLLDIKGIVAILRASGSAKRLSKTFDFCGKCLGVSDEKTVPKVGGDMKVSEAAFVDNGGGKIVVSVWQEAHRALESLQVGVGLAIIGCSATYAGESNSEVKLNIWPGVHVSTAGAQAQSLTSLDATSLATETLTPTFAPGQDLATLVEGEAHPTCAAALGDAVCLAGPITFQINRCLLDPPLQEELLYTRDGRLFIRNCRLRDGTGGVDVDVVSSAVPAIYDCASEAEVKEQIGAQSLTSTKMRVNARGVLRNESGAQRKYIVKLEFSPMGAVVSMTAMRLSLGLSTVSDDVVLPAPASRIFDAPMLGLALRRDSGEPVGAFRVLLLVRGTTETDVDPIDDQLPMAQQAFKVTSPSACCLLSDGAFHINLVGYCSFKNMMAYRLDKETALVLVSAVATAAPGSASAASDGARVAGGPSASGPLVATVEHIQKVSKDEVAALTLSMGAEWKSVLAEASAQGTSPGPLSSKESEYWSVERAKKVRRVQSEPQSPLASAAALRALQN